MKPIPIRLVETEKICSTLQTEIVQQIEFNTFARTFLVSNTESGSKMFGEIRLN